MIYINLLPWRDHKYKKRRARFCLQLFASLIAAILIAALVWLKNTHRIEGYQAQLEIITKDNQGLFLQLEQFQSAQALFLKQQQQVEKINQLILQRQAVPKLLLMLQSNQLSFEINRLTINEQGMKLKGNSVSSVSSLQLLNSLRDESVFCQVTLTPFQSNQSTASSSFEFELQAELCNE